MISAYPTLNNFPRIDAVNLTPQQQAVSEVINAQHKAWRGLKVGMAYALIRTGQSPYVKPPAAVVAKRRKAAKAARKARRAGR